MTEVLELAKHGNIEAITKVLNRKLKARNILAKAILKDDCLKVMLEAPEIPNQQETAPIVVEAIINLKVEFIQTVHLFGRQFGGSAPAWQQIIHLKAETVTPPKNAQNQSNKETITSEPSQTQQTQAQNSVETIASVVNRAIEDKNLTAKINLESQHLKVVIETPQFLDGQVIADVIYKALLGMNSTEFKTAQLYKQRSEKAQPFLIKEMVFEKETSPVAIDAAVSSVPENSARSTAVGTLPLQPASVKKVPEMQRIKKTRRMIGLVLGSIIAAFVIIGLVKRLAWAFTSPLGGFSVVIALFFLWRAWSVLGPLLQNFLRDE